MGVLSTTYQSKRGVGISTQRLDSFHPQTASQTICNVEPTVCDQLRLYRNFQCNHYDAYGNDLAGRSSLHHRGRCDEWLTVSRAFILSGWVVGGVVRNDQLHPNHNPCNAIPLHIHVTLADPNQPCTKIQNSTDNCTFWGIPCGFHVPHIRCCVPFPFPYQSVLAHSVRQSVIMPFFLIPTLIMCTPRRIFSQIWKESFVLWTFMWCESAK